MLSHTAAEAEALSRHQCGTRNSRQGALLCTTSRPAAPVQLFSFGQGPVVLRDATCVSVLRIIPGVLGEPCVVPRAESNLPYAPCLLNLKLWPQLPTSPAWQPVAEPQWGPCKTSSLWLSLFLCLSLCLPVCLSLSVVMVVKVCP